jgi:hypothetical protein
MNGKSPGRVVVRLLLLFALALVCAGVTMWGGMTLATVARNSRSAPTEHAALILERDTCDLGWVSAGDSPTAIFTVHNGGSRRLVLRQLGRSCECLLSEVAEMIVPAGESRKIIARVNTRDERGLLRLEVRYRTNDPQHPLLVLYALVGVREPPPSRAAPNITAISGGGKP